MWRRLALGTRSPRVVLALGYLGFLLYAFPGYMSMDSTQQLGEARAGHYSDGHPPAMAAMWHIVELFVSGPAAMLLLQSVAFLVGVHRLLRRDFTRTTAAYLAVAILWFPPIVAPMAVVWKDSQMAGYLMLGLSLVLDDRRRMKLLGAGVLALACAMRDNAAAATLPLLLGAFAWSPADRRVKRWAIAIAVWGVTTSAAMLVNAELTSSRQYMWHSSLATADIVGILKHAPAAPDPELEAVLAGTPLHRHTNISAEAVRTYNPRTWWAVVNGPDRMFDWPATTAHRDALARSWTALVEAHPGAYLHHRLRVFRAVIGLGGAPIFDTVWHEFINPNYAAALHYNAAPSGLQTTLGELLVRLGATLLFRPYLYLYLALALLPFAWRHRDLLALLASGIVYELTLVPFAPSPDFRYSHWMIVATVIAVVVLVGRRARAGRRSVDPMPGVL